MSFEGTKYFFIKNIQGDVEKIVTHQGNVAVTYKYDAWGKLISKTDNTVYGIGELNPFRYRGYIYDDETGLYYLKSRYYDPITGRFLNADTYTDTETGSPLSTNMFSYCENNHINYIDFDGNWLSANYKKSKNHITIKIKLPWKDISDYYKYQSYAYGIAGIIACFIPEATVSKALGIVFGICSISSGIISEIISAYKKNKSIIIKISFNYKIVKSTGYFYIVNTWLLKIRIKYKKNTINIYNLKWKVSH